MSTSTSRTAILHHNLRGSGREVMVSAIEIGLDLSTEAGAPIAVWPYAALEFAAPPEHAELAELRMKHDDVYNLRLFGQELIDVVISRSPTLAKEKREARTNRALRVFDGLPASPLAALYIGLFIGAVWLIHWIAGFFE